MRAVTLALALLLIAGAAFADSVYRPQYHQWAVLKKTWGCPDLDGFRRVTAALHSGDEDAADKIFDAKGCRMFKGSTVYIEEEIQFLSPILVRPKGEPNSYWVPYFSSFDPVEQAAH